MLRTFLIRLCIVATLPGSTAWAAVVPGPIFGDGMVLQRDRPVPVWGRAAAGETVTVSFGGRTVSGKADADGRWKVALEPLAADATPREMTIVGAADRVLYKDVLVGEVWLCSGQSNMGLEVRKVINATDEIAAATDPQIRAFTALNAPGKDGWYEFDPSQKRYAMRPQEKCLGSWKPCVGKDVVNVSAVGYFFARELKKNLGVPVGIVVCSMGATAIESWISVEGLKAIPRYRSRAIAWEELAAAYLADKDAYPAAVEAQRKRVAAESKAWFAKLDAEDPGLAGGWMAPGLDTAGWSAIELPVTVDDNPIGAPIASIWFRKEVTIPPAWVGKELELHLGTIDAVDDTYVNGKPVGRTWFDREKYWEVPRVYAVPAEAVTGTTVSVTMRLLKLAYHMAPIGPAEEMKLVPKGSVEKPAPVSLAGGWRMRKAQDLEYGDQPQVSPFLATPPGEHYGNAGVQYNGLIHPIAPYAIRGAIWYQGEANAPFYIDYRSLMPGLITSWRKEWGYDFPFGIVQLADYFGQQTAPVERGGYTNLRESQAIAAAATPGTFLATAVGVGEGNDIHPKRKQEVGRRLALNALGVVYGLTDRTHTGPTYTSMKAEGDRIRLSFDHARGLHAEGEPPVGFAIAGKDRAFYFAQAKIEGEQVVVWSEKVPEPVAVRYAWATNPVCNLSNDENLPMFQFRTDEWDLSQLVIPTDTIVIPKGWKPK